jgi:hypothetical protein
LWTKENRKFKGILLIKELRMKLYCVGDFYGGAVPFRSGIIGDCSGVAVSGSCPIISGVLLRVNEDVSVSSGIVENFFKTCLRAGRRIGLL